MKNPLKKLKTRTTFFPSEYLSTLDVDGYMYHIYEHTYLCPYKAVHLSTYIHLH